MIKYYHKYSMERAIDLLCENHQRIIFGVSNGKLSEVAAMLDANGYKYDIRLKSVNTKIDADCPAYISRNAEWIVTGTIANTKTLN